MAVEIETGTFGETDRDHVLCSIAISAKRAADAQERQARALENIAESMCGEYGIGAAIWKLTKG